MINRLSDRNSMAICLYWQIKLIFLGWRDVIKVTQEFMMNKNMAAEFYKSSDRNSCWKSSWLWFLYLLWYRYCSNMLPILCNQLLFWSIFDLWSQLIYLIFKSRTDSILISATLPVDLYLIFEKSSWKSQVRRTGFLVYFKLDFYCLCSLQKSISKLIFLS